MLFRSSSSSTHNSCHPKNKKIYYYLTDEWDENASKAVSYTHLDVYKRQLVTHVFILYFFDLYVYRLFLLFLQNRVILPHSCLLYTSNIKKSNGKLRPLGIPTMKDRAMQALYLMALEPVSETCLLYTSRCV